MYARQLVRPRAEGEGFKVPTTSLLAKDKRGRRVVLFQSKWDKQAAARMNPEVELLDMA